MGAAETLQQRVLDLNQYIEARSAKKTDEQIAQEYGMTMNRLLQWKNEHDIAVMMTRESIYTLKDKHNLSDAKIGAIYGVSSVTVHNRRKKDAESVAGVKQSDTSQTATTTGGETTAKPEAGGDEVAEMQQQHIEVLRENLLIARENEANKDAELEEVKGELEKAKQSATYWNNCYDVARDEMDTLQAKYTELGVKVQELEEQLSVQKERVSQEQELRLLAEEGRDLLFQDISRIQKELELSQQLLKMKL